MEGPEAWNITERMVLMKDAGYQNGPVFHLDNSNVKPTHRQSIHAGI